MSHRVPHLCGYIYPLCNNLEVCEPTLELWSLSGTCAWSPLVPLLSSSSLSKEMLEEQCGRGGKQGKGGEDIRSRKVKKNRDELQPFRHSQQKHTGGWDCCFSREKAQARELPAHALTCKKKKKAISSAYGRTTNIIELQNGKYLTFFFFFLLQTEILSYAGPLLSGKSLCQVSCILNQNMKHANSGFVLHHRERIYKQIPRFSFLLLFLCLIQAIKIK